MCVGTTFLVFFWVATAVNAQCNWGYRGDIGPENPVCWPGACQSGQHQSPIDIPHFRNLTYVKHWLPLRWLNYHENYHHLMVTNTGKTVRIDIPRDCGRPRVKNGGLAATFELDHILLHWGSKHRKGSEHKFQHERYSAEVQFVHVNEKCGRSMQEAMYLCQGNMADAYAIMSVLLEVGDKENWAYNNIFDAIDHVTMPESSHNVDPTELISLYPEDKNHFYRYMGSFSTPDVECSEEVSWTVFKDPVKVSLHQLRKLWHLKSSWDWDADGKVSRLINNFRPVQPVNEREVIYADLDFDCKHKGWRDNYACDLQYMEQHSKYDFYQSYHKCIDYSDFKTARVGLIPVGKLRCLRNNFEFGSPMIQNEHDICGRYFRVNAIKNHKGEWKEFGSGNWVPLHHFPDFDPSHGKSGDTLVWDALVNRLIITESHEMYHSMCYREFESCDNCVGFNVNHECSDSGYCHDVTCTCDNGFEGNQCGVTPIPSKDIITIGALNSELDARINTKQEDPQTICVLPQYTDLNPTAEVEMFCDFIFGRVFCCGGHTHPDRTTGADSLLPNTDICGYLDCHHHEWRQIHDFPTPLYFEAAAVVEKDGEDYAWIASGGENDGMKQDRVYIMKHDLRWDTVPTVMPRHRSGHCSVQINDCEIALIGGGEGVWHDLETAGSFYSATSYVLEIDIYNFKTNKWRTGPTLPQEMLVPGCARIRDHISNEMKVVIGCDSTSNSMLLWDLTTNDVNVLPDHECPNVRSGFYYSFKFKELDDQNIAVTNLNVADVLTFNIDQGFSDLMFDLANKLKGDSAVAPPGLYDCQSFSD